ncbi:hypothetical protein MWJ18_001452 [Campylobacter lari]|nr:hypothetical protein [Campylobacter lari]EAH7781097.1 hypothetical protein [Campylobacter lari]EAH8420758.1 hypothetical protein [Campylobacter lari]EAI0904441.1 hypothetical protein [Campylobacter lari]EAI2357841.1 hypothetical protein [Campylobacter lari]
MFFANNTIEQMYNEKKEGAVTDCYIKVSKEDLEKIDFFLKEKKITLKTKLETNKLEFSEKERFYLSLFGCVLLTLIFVSIFFGLSWFIALTITNF